MISLEDIIPKGKGLEIGRKLRSNLFEGPNLDEMKTTIYKIDLFVYFGIVCPAEKIVN